MFVFLKILLFFFRPLVWICFIFIYALLTKAEKRKRKAFIFGAALTLFFSNPFIIRSLIRAYELPPVDIKQMGHYNAGIVLGGFVSYNIKEDKGYFNPASDRFIETALLYKTGHINKIIVAAGNGYIVRHLFREAEFVKQKLMDLGIPGTDIYTDPDSKNTLENATDSRRIIDSAHLQGPYLLISSAFHLPRAIYLFHKFGMQVTPFPCDFLSRSVGNNFFEDYFLPNSEAFNYWDIYIKELAGRAAYKLKP